MLALLVLACSDPDTAPPDTEATDVVDMIVDFPTAPADAIEWVTPDMVIPPQSEVMYCLYDTYDGPTVGMHAQATYQSQFGHHVALNGTSTSALDVPDGTMVDCSGSSNETMADISPLLIGGDIHGLTLPEGDAAYLETGKRVVIQSHYVNTSDDAIRVRDAIQISTIPEDEVTTWVAPFVYVDTDDAIPAGESRTVSFDCAWAQDTSLLYLGGHMHEWGTAFSVDYTPVGGETSRVYEVADWQPEYRDTPLYDEYAPGEFPVKTGDSFKTTCSWDNTTSEDLAFPSEMCVTFGMYYPGKSPWICDATP